MLEEEKKDEQVNGIRNEKKRVERKTSNRNLLRRKTFETFHNNQVLRLKSGLESYIFCFSFSYQFIFLFPFFLSLLKVSVNRFHLLEISWLSSKNCSNYYSFVSRDQSFLISFYYSSIFRSHSNTHLLNAQHFNTSFYR